MHGRAELFSNLIEKGADPEIEDGVGNTPNELAALNPSVFGNIVNP